MNAFLGLVFVSALGAASLPIHESGFAPGPGGMPAGWSTWSARAETAPRCFVDPLHYRSGAGSLAISGNSNLAEHGGWHRTIGGIQAGSWYRLIAWYRTEGVAHESLQVLARLDWRDGQDRRAGQ